VKPETTQNAGDTMKEKPIQHLIWERLSGLSTIRLFRNNVGLGFTRTGTPIRFGLRVGSADLIGWKSVTITPNMVGRRVAVFVSIETKSPTGTPSPDQINWMQNVTEAGGLAGIARGLQDAMDIVDGSK